MKWRLVELFSQTLECQHVHTYQARPETSKSGTAKPTYVTHEDCLYHDEDGCGWPCQVYPYGWEQDAKACLAAIRELEMKEKEQLAAWSEKYIPWRRNAKVAPLNSKFFRKGTFSVLARALQVCVEQVTQATPLLP